MATSLSDSAGSPLLRPPAATAEEAAAIVIALEQFLLDTAPLAPAAEPAPSAWKRAALLEATARRPRFRDRFQSKTS